MDKTIHFQIQRRVGSVLRAVVVAAVLSVLPGFWCEDPPPFHTPSDPIRRASGIDVAMTPNGEGFVVWSVGAEDYLVSYFPGAGWTERTLLTLDGGSSRLLVDADASGIALLAYVEDEADEVMVRWFQPPNSWSAPAVLGEGDRIEAMAMDGLSGAHVVWREQELWSARFDVNDGWEAPVQHGFASAPAVAAHSSGTAVMISGSAPTTFGKRYDPGTGWSAAEEVGPHFLRNGQSIDLELVMSPLAPSGAAYAFWDQEDAYQFAIFDPGAGWAQAVDIDFEIPSVSRSHSIAMDEQSRVLIVAGADALDSRLYVPSSGWGPVMRFLHGDLQSSTGMDMDREGTAISVFRAGSQLVGTRFDPDLGWGALWPIPGSNDSASTPRVAVSAARTVLVAWIQDRLNAPGSILEREIFQLGDFPQNLAPVADASASPSSGEVDQTIELDGSASSDPDDQPLNYDWVLVDSPPGSSIFLEQSSTELPWFIPDQPGDYVFELTVKDNFLSDTDQVSVSVGGGITPSIYVDAPQEVLPRYFARIHATPENFPVPDDIVVSWSVDSIPAGSTAQLAPPAPATGQYIVHMQDISVGDYQLTVTMDDGNHNISKPISIGCHDGSTLPQCDNFTAEMFGSDPSTIQATPGSTHIVRMTVVRQPGYTELIVHRRDETAHPDVFTDVSYPALTGVIPISVTISSDPSVAIPGQSYVLPVIFQSLDTRCDLDLTFEIVASAR